MTHHDPLGIILIVTSINCGVAAINQWMACCHRRHCEEIRKEIADMNDAWRRGECKTVEWRLR